MALSACSRSVPEEAPPPPPAVAEAPPPVLAGGPTDTRRPGWGTMAPIPNPGDMSPSQRASAQAWNDAHPGGPRERRVNGRLVVAMAPIPNPAGLTAAQRRHYGYPAYHPKPRARPHVERTWSPPVQHAAPAPAPKPAARPAPLPAPVAAVPLNAAPKPAPVAPPAGDAKLNSLKAALAGEVVKGSKLDVPTAELLAGKESKVTLSLPASLLGSIQREAAKLGLGKAASKSSVSAKLTGAGYSITPNGAQTAKLAKGKGPAFSWLVHPTGDARGPLTASVDASLNGDGKPKAFSLLTIQSAIASLPNLAADAGEKVHAPGWWKHLNLRMLDIPGYEKLQLPVVGKVASHNVVALVIIAMILLLLINIAGGASRRRAAAESRRRRRQAMAYGADEPAHEAEAHDDHGHGGGLAAAALGGAALGAVAAHAADHHDDQGHGHDAHGHDDHGHAAAHDAHGHDAHGHDDHGAHGHDAHAGAHDDHGHDAHGHDAHGHDAHGHDDHAVAAHDDHGHDAHGHDDHGHGAVAHDDHGHGHDDHAAAHDDHGHDTHGHDAHGHDSHGHDDHGHGAHAEHREKEHEHA